VSEDSLPPPSGDYIQSLGRGLTVLEILGRGSASVTVGHVAEEAGVNRATARRLLTTLETLGYVIREGREFRLTPKVLGLGYSYLSALGVSDILSGVLRTLSQSLGEAVSVTIRDKDQIVYVARQSPDRVMTVSLTLGARLPVWNTSMGRVLLTALTDEEIRNLWQESGPLRAFTPRTLTSLEEIIAVVGEARNNGWVMVDQELEWGLRSVAVPLKRSGRIVAALNAATANVGEDPAETRKRMLPALNSAALEAEEVWRMLPPSKELS
jgi:IclR family transcriptional regulator, pca regulon regulatory protein